MKVIKVSAPASYMKFGFSEPRESTTSVEGLLATIRSRSSWTDVWYWYVIAPYEGAGHLIARRLDGRFAVVGLDHCSCYGPGDCINRRSNHHDTYASLDDLIAGHSEDAVVYLKPLVDAIREEEA